MNYDEKIKKIKELISKKCYETAEQELLKMLDEEPIKEVEDENSLHFSFSNYIESLIYWKKYKPKKKLVQPINDMSEIYFILGYICMECKNYEKAIKHLENAIIWNPISPRIRFEIADAYRNIGNIEKYKVEIEKTYKNIYSSSFMAKYYRELGWYYIERKLFNLANALYTHSLRFLTTELATNELIYIAQQENREPKITPIDDVKSIFKEYSIPIGIDTDIIDIIYEQSEIEKNEHNDELANYLYRALYDITLDKKYMLYVNLKDDKTNIVVKVPEIWKFVKRENYRRLGISDDTIFFFSTPENETINIVCDGKCNGNELDEAYKKNIEYMKNFGIIIEKELTIRDRKNINQVYVLVNLDGKVFRVCQNYLIANGYLLNVSWEVLSNVPIDNLIKSNSNSFEMQLILSL